jgi:hypothetical protein
MSDMTKCKTCKCSRCGSDDVWHREDDRGDFYHACRDCKKTWWVEGPDS